MESRQASAVVPRGVGAVPGSGFSIPFFIFSSEWYATYFDSALA